MKDDIDYFFEFKLLDNDTYSIVGRKFANGCKRCNIKFVEIPAIYNGKPVTEIGAWAFNNCKNLTDITIPESIISFGHRAFRNCKSLTSVHIPYGVTVIRQATFSGCESLESVTLPEGINKIDEFAFYNCKNLKDINIPDKVSHIGYEAFHSCDSLKSVTIPTYTYLEFDVDGKSPFPSGCVVNVALVKVDEDLFGSGD